MTQDGFGGGYPPSSSSSAPAATEAAPAAPVEVDGEGEDEDEAAGHAATGSEEGDATTRGEELEEEGEGGVGHGHGGHDHLSPLVALPGRHNKRGAAAAALALGGGATPTASGQHKQHQQQGQQGQGGQGGGRARKKSRPSIETGGVDGVAASLRQLAPLVAPAHAAAAAGLAPPPAPPSVRRGVSSGRKAPRRFDCNLYGPIAMDGLCLEIIDTPQFQRLGYISQLGACPLVYRGATHTRCVGGLRFWGLGFVRLYICGGSRPQSPCSDTHHTPSPPMKRLVQAAALPRGGAPRTSNITQPHNPNTPQPHKHHYPHK